MNQNILGFKKTIQWDSNIQDIYKKKLQSKPVYFGPVDKIQDEQEFPRPLEEYSLNQNIDPVS